MNFKGEFKKLSVVSDGEHLLNIAMADGILTRARGLLFHQPLNEEQGLLLSPCNAVHTFFMRYRIDVYFIDEHRKVLKVCKNLKPWRQAMCLSAKYVLEVKENNARMSNICVGEKLVWA
ncbi:DUF192 domain-containing protein [Agarilytica rhodophyticola]|uniref:DUF192 domain-containing protein n=1 Tax=Agarilytica rhodophyticola TaxID=1737490 RepID=UPI000B3482F2|nr:DUF192 domain-containing protein [Agarilytica rhodophyticola]